MSQVVDFDDQFFNSIAVPLTRDYSRLSSSPSRDIESNTPYFERRNPEIECDSPVKMKLPKAVRDANECTIQNTNENFLSSSSSSEGAVGSDSKDENVGVGKAGREPLRIVPSEVVNVVEGDLTEQLSRLAMFAPKEPEERLSQRRRSEMKKKQAEEEENKRRSVMNTTAPTAATARTRSISVKRATSVESSRIPTSRGSRANSVTKTTPGSGVLTRSMAKAAGTSEGEAAAVPVKPALVRKNVPIKISVKTPIAPNVATTTTSRSRDRTRRPNVTGLSASGGTRRTMMTRPTVPQPALATTPVAPPRRATSQTRTLTNTGTRARPIATANRSSTLRMNAMKAAETTAPTVAPVPKPIVSRPAAVPATGPTKNRVPLRVVPGSTVKAPKPPVMSTSANRPSRPRGTTPVSIRATSSSRVPTVGASVKAATPRQDVNAFYKRLSTPKFATTPARASQESAAIENSVRKSHVRPVPSYVRGVTNTGLPLTGGIHGIRAPSRDRGSAKGSVGNLSTTSQK